MVCVKHFSSFHNKTYFRVEWRTGGLIRLSLGSTIDNKWEYLLFTKIYHHTKNKGDLGVLKVKLDLCLKGYLILSPETEHFPFDLVILKDGIFKSVQVKFKNLNKRDVLEIPFRNCYSTSKGVMSKLVDKSLIDIYAVFCPETDECYYFDPKQFKRSISLRVKTSLNSQQQGIHFADDFKTVPWNLCDLY